MLQEAKTKKRGVRGSGATTRRGHAKEKTFPTMEKKSSGPSSSAETSALPPASAMNSAEDELRAIQRQARQMKAQLGSQ